jgi:hypothetical protein
MRRVSKDQPGKPYPNHLIDQASRPRKKKDDVQYRFPMELIGKHRGRDFNSETAISGEEKKGWDASVLEVNPTPQPKEGG